MLRTPEPTPVATVLPPTRAAGLTSPHQNVRWQNRKAAVCSRHLKVHLHTLFQQSPSAPISAKAVEVGYRDQCLDQHACGFQLLLFPDCVCLVAFLNFKKKSHKTRHFTSAFRKAKGVLNHGAGHKGGPWQVGGGGAFLQYSSVPRWFPNTYGHPRVWLVPSSFFKAGDATVPVAMVSLQHKTVWIHLAACHIWDTHCGTQETWDVRKEGRDSSLEINSCGWVKVFE